MAAGADRPLVREPWSQPSVHGASGLDGADLPEPAFDARPETGDRADGRARARHPTVPVTLVPTGPLTNVALFLRAFPALHDRIGAISLMGGSLGVGNTTASAEFNVWQDPEAAAIVFDVRHPDPDGRPRRDPPGARPARTTSPGSRRSGRGPAGSSPT